MRIGSLRLRAPVVRAAALLVLIAYTIAAVVNDARRAMPLVIVEAMVASYYMLCSKALRSAAHEMCFRSRGARPYQQRRDRALCRWWIDLNPWRRLAVAIIVALLHVGVVASVGAASGERWRPVAGFGMLISACYAASRDRHAVKWRAVAAGLALQFWLCFILPRTSVGLAAVRWIALEVGALLGYARVGAIFVFGADAVASMWAFKVLTVTIFFSSLCSVLLHVGFLQWLFGRLGGALFT